MTMNTTLAHKTPPISRQSGLASRIKTPPAQVIQVLILAALALGLAWQVNPPAPLPLSAPATEFSAERAMTYVEAIAQKPHPLGSPENARVRQYLVDTLRSMRLEPEVQTAAVTKSAGRVVSSGTVNNIVARLKGTGSSRAVMLAAHYDSPPDGPGAADDAAGVAAILETVRALQAGAPLANDVILLITDGEENWLLGAKAFIDGYPWARDVGVVLNFEARGNAGPVSMFETSDGNGWLIRQFAEAAPYPSAYAFISDLYKAMPNDTDLTEFKRGGMAGLNFAMASGWATYHQPQDNAAALDRGSLQHLGSYALALTRRFGSLALDNPRAENRVYFTVAGRLLNYPQSWSVPLAMAAALLLVAVVVLGIRRKRLSIARSGLGVLVFLLNLAVAGALGFIAVQALTGLFHESAIVPTRDSRLYAAEFAALALAGTGLLYGWLRSRLGAMNLAAGAAAGWLCLTLLTAFILPGGSYLFVWPLFFYLLALALAFIAPPSVTAVAQWVTLLPAAACLALFVPALSVLFVLIPVTIYWAGMVVAACVWALLVPQIACWLLPQVR